MNAGKCIGQNIIFAAIMDFDKNPQRSQHIASRLAKTNNVFYMESPFSLPGFFRNGCCEFNKVIRYMKGARRHSSSLVLWTPPPSLYPLDKLPWVGKLYARMVAYGIKRALRSLKWQETPIIYATNPWTAWIGISLPHRLIVLDWFSPWIEHWAHLLLRNPIWKPLVRANYWLKERNTRGALIHADLILCGARIYQKLANAWGFTTMFLPNGAEMSMWENSSKNELSPPSEVTSVSGLRIGVICARIHNGFVDLDLIEKVAQARPGWSWLLIGLPMGKMDRLQALPNVHFLGHKPYQDLPHYVAGFDLCAIPYILRTTTQSGIPVKLLEYLPSGKPIITYPTPEVQQDIMLGSLVYYASTPDEFIRAAETAIADDPIEIREKRDTVIKQYDWDTLAGDLSAKIARRLQETMDVTSSACR